jgi:hypothetical protein
MQTNARFARGPAGNFHILVTHSVPACAQGLDHGFFGSPAARQPVHHIGGEVIVQQSFGIKGFPRDRSSQRSPTSPLFLGSIDPLQKAAPESIEGCSDAGDINQVSTQIKHGD